MIKTYQYHSKGFGCNVQVSYKDGVICGATVEDSTLEVIFSENNPQSKKAFFFVYEEGLLDATKGKTSIIEMNREITFEMFWDAYGYKHGKAEALKAWNRLSKKDQQEAYYYIPAYESFRKANNHNKLMAASYLNAKRWVK